MTTQIRPAGLAIDGGTPVRSEPMPPRIQIDEREIDAVTGLMRRRMEQGGAFDRYDGPEVDIYERELADYFGFGFVTCVSAGTAAIHSALGALDLEPGSEVIVASFTDPGSVMPILFQQCVPVFTEHDFDTVLQTPESVRAAITPWTRAIILAQLHGYVCDMEAMRAIAREHNLVLIGDMSQSHGSTYRGSLSEPFGDIGAMSLMSGKHMVAGGQAGMVTTNDEAVYWAAKRFADRGKPFGTDAPSNVGIGLNYRMHEIEAAMGRVQLQKLAGIKARRKAALAIVHEGIADLATVRPVRALPGVDINPWSALFLVERNALTVDNVQFAAAMAAEGIPVHHSYRNAINYGLQYYRQRKTFGSSGFPWGHVVGGRKIEWQEFDFPVVERIAQSLLLLEIHESWTERESEDTVAAFRKVDEAYRR
jgi:dTDP-4-amino-4,6-dideoxygalactose transaminase